MRVDLNLFTVFEAIYNEGNLTKAANTLHITQPAISHSLAKLRGHFDDALFVRQGHQMTPTPLSKRLIHDVRNALATLNTTLLSNLEFIPENATNLFKIGLRDALESTCLPPLIEATQKTAPGIKIVSLRHNRKTMENDLSSGQVDLIIDVAQPVSELISRKQIISERLCVVSRKNNPNIKTVLDLETYLNMNHVVASYRASGAAIEDVELNRYGLNRNITLRCQHYFAACQVVSNTDLLLTIPESYAQLLKSKHSGLNIHAFPIESPSVDIHLYVNKMRSKEPEIEWLVSSILTLFQQTSSKPTTY
ncbi:LysR family transcriptional regulator [Litoribacillus peritrichatus]|uniref:LysR family transcriptional regulator n=1 Tax=Litoribacillus peritrichatus TaxID=718191 RepID=A0ABP7MC35_9GAMM